MKRSVAILAVVVTVVVGAWIGRSRAAAPPDLARWDAEIRAAAEAAGLDPQLVRAVVAVESSGDPRAVSHAGARGLMQLMPPTAAEQAGKLGIEDHDEQRLLEGPYNLRLGCAYLAYLLRRYDGAEPFALAAYNAGPTRVHRWREAAPDASPEAVIEREAFPETRAYVRKVLRYRSIYSER